MNSERIAEICKKPPIPLRAYSLILPTATDRSASHKGIGKAAHALDTSSRFYSAGKSAIAPHTGPASIAISFGWNCGGFGKKDVEILFVSHGGNKNDTIVNIAKKVPNFTKE